MQDSNTAADRLLRIMRVVAQSPEEPMVKVWARAMNLNSQDKITVFAGIVSLAELIKEVESIVTRHGGSAANLYLRSLAQVRLCLMTGVEAHRSNLTHILKPEVLVDLEHCAVMYSNVDQEIAISSEQINSIKKDVDALFQEVSKSNLSSELKNQLLDLLEVMRRQLSEFEIRGATALRECLRQAFARLSEVYPEVEKHKNTPLLKKLSSVMKDLGDICESAQKALPIVKHVVRLLPFTGAEGVTDTQPIDAELVN